MRKVKGSWLIVPPMLLVGSVGSLLVHSATSTNVIQLEAESFAYCDGTYVDGQPDPVSKYAVAGINAVNYVNRDDMMAFTVDVPEAGDYSVTYQIATAVGQGAEIQVQVLEQGVWKTYARMPVSASGWDNFYPLKASSTVPLLAGSQEIRVVASGSNDWQWNLDALTLVKVAETPVDPDPVDPTTDPDPVTPPNGTNPINVSGSFSLEAEHYQGSGGELSTYTINGRKAVNYFNTGDYIEFYLDLDKSGLYSVSYELATEHTSGASADLLATDSNGDLSLRSTTNISSPHRSWDSYFTVKASSNLNLFAGKATIRIKGSGSEDFQFNIDKLVFTRIGDADLSFDADGDGTPDINDMCPSTPSTEQANFDGCSPSQLDSDSDGIADNVDQCSATPPGAFVDSLGCESSGGDDDDFDGVFNTSDSCADTPYGTNVNAQGCALGSNTDSDSDGIANNIDVCANTPLGEFADSTGCSASQRSLSEVVSIDINANIRHEVNGVSDFGRDRHMTTHSAIYEQDWNGHHDKLNYLLNTLDVYMGRDNGSATWRFQETQPDASTLGNPNWMDSVDNAPRADMAWMAARGKVLREDYANNEFYKLFPNSKTELIAGTNPHPTYPTLSWYDNGKTWTGWQTYYTDISAEWVAQYLKHYYANASNGYVGEPMPKYWEVINEPDMKMKTGQFMVTNQEEIWRYHKLVAQKVREALGDEAPLIGGMTWGQHDFYRRDGISRFGDDNYTQWIKNSDPSIEQKVQRFYREAMETPVDDTRGSDWYQWDVMWRGFMETAGDDMDFYSVHIYDWPSVSANGRAGTLRRGGHVQAMLDMMEWYDVNKGGIQSRKPIVMSEYGAVQGGWDDLPHEERYDVEGLKSFNAMLMQFLERPDYIVKSMPFTPAKPLWGYMPGGCGYDAKVNCTVPYHYGLLLESQLNNGDWQWSPLVRFFELWADIDGTRVVTSSTDADVQVDAYVKDNEMFVILNNLESKKTSIDLGMFGVNAQQVHNVEMRQMSYGDGNEVNLVRRHMKQLPSNLILDADGTVVLRIQLTAPVAINQDMTEHKYFAESLSGSVPHRISVSGGEKTIHVNQLAVPSGASEAMLRLTVSLFPDKDDIVGGNLTINSLKVNGHKVETPIDWRGPASNSAERYFATLEIPVPTSVLQANNTIKVDFKHMGEMAAASIVVSDYSKAPQYH